MKKVAVLLSGCGVFDGTEIHESVLTLYAYPKRGLTTNVLLLISNRCMWSIT